MVGDETIRNFDYTALGIECDAAGIVPRTTGQIL
jgi:hypothetical protein